LERKAAKKAEATINRELTMLKHLFSKCITWKFAKSTPMKDVKLYKESNNRGLIRKRAVCWLPATRISVSSHLRQCSPDFGAMNSDHCDGRMWISKTIRSQVESAYSKNGEVGSVPLHPDLKKALKQLDDERKPAPEDNVFRNRCNKPWKSWRTAFENACERAKIKDFHFHDLRHHADSRIMPTPLVELAAGGPRVAL
jgi:hypothetical protein